MSCESNITIATRTLGGETLVSFLTCVTLLDMSSFGCDYLASLILIGLDRDELSPTAETLIKLIEQRGTEVVVVREKPRGIGVALSVLLYEVKRKESEYCFFIDDDLIFSTWHLMQLLVLCDAGADAVSYTANDLESRVVDKIRGYQRKIRMVDPYFSVVKGWLIDALEYEWLDMLSEISSAPEAAFFSRLFYELEALVFVCDNQDRPFHIFRIADDKPWACASIEDYYAVVERVHKEGSLEDALRYSKQVADSGWQSLD